MLQSIEIETFDDFNTILHPVDYNLIQLSASWCAPCVKIKSELEKDSEWLDKYEGKLRWFKIDIDKMEGDEDLSKLFIFKKIPTFVLLKGLTKKDEGIYTNKNDLIGFLDKNIYSFSRIISLQSSDDF